VKNTVWVPLVGTVAALLATLAGHGEQEGSVYPLTIEAPKARPREPEKQKEKEPVSVVRKFRMVLNEDGTFAVVEMLAGGAEKKEPLGFRTLEEFLDYAAPKGKPRPFVLLVAASSKVTNEMLLKAARTLAERCEVKLESRDSKKAPDKEAK